MGRNRSNRQSYSEAVRFKFFLALKKHDKYKRIPEYEFSKALGKTYAGFCLEPKVYKLPASKATFRCMGCSSSTIYKLHDW